MGETGRPEMYFNMGFKRGVYGAFIGNLIPMIIVALIMFGSLFPGSIEPEQAAATGFNTLGAVSFTVTMLLVAVFQHISIRSAVGGALSYVDYLMFALYTVILLVTLNAILIRSLRPPRWITAHNNLAAKVLYWPVLLGLALPPQSSPSPEPKSQRILTQGDVRVISRLPASAPVRSCVGRSRRWPATAA